MSEKPSNEAVDLIVGNLMNFPGPTYPAPAHGSRAEPVRLVIPAHRDFVVLVRSAAAHLGTRIGMPTAEIDDFRLAVDEACCLFLTGGPPAGPTLACEFTEADGAVTVTVSGPVRGDFAGAKVGTFGWTLLQFLVDDLWWSTDGAWAEVRLRKCCRAGGPSLFEG